MRQDPTRLPLRVAERAGRLLFWVMQLPDLTQAERELACWFITDGDGEYMDTITSIPEIASDLGVHKNTVGAAMRSLRSKGLVRNEKRKNAGGQPTSDRNRLIAPPELARLRTTVKGAEGDLDVADFKIGDTRFGSPGTRMGSSDTKSVGAGEPIFVHEPSSLKENEPREIEEGSGTNVGPPPFATRRRRKPEHRLSSSAEVFGAIGGAA